MLTRAIGYSLALTFNLLFSPFLMGATSTANMTVNATVLNACIVTAPIISFGNISGTFSSNIDNSTFSITNICTTGTNYSITIGPGANANGTFRRMALLTNFIGYQLFSDAGYSVPWGNGTTFGNGVSGTATGLIESFTVYARIPSGQTPVPIGAYIDTPVVVTTTY